MQSRGRKPGATEAKVQEDLHLLKLSETIPYVRMEYIGKATEWSALAGDRKLSVCAVSTLNRCVNGAVLKDAGEFEVFFFLGRHRI